LIDTAARFYHPRLRGGAVVSFGHIVLLVYALLMLAGAFAGSRAGSRVSLYAGTTAGVLLLLALLLTAIDLRLGFGLGVAVSVVLCGVFLARFLKTKVFMPAGMLLVVSVTALALLSFYLI
jgi:uncharacterized membrane protein (UPF0136 family)